MRLDGVGRRYGLREDWVLSGVDLSLPQGSLVRIEGANGSGKSTLLRLLAGIDAPNAGRISGRPSSAYVPERFPTSMPLTALGYLTLMARVHGLRGAAAAREAKDWMERFGVATYARTSLAELSKGTAQKVAVAQALMARPGLLALDEAWTGLDHAARAVLDQAVAGRVSNGGTVVYVDHNPRPLAGAADATYLLIDGRLSSPVRDQEKPAALRDGPSLDAAFAFARDAQVREGSGRDFPVRDLPVREIREGTPLAPVGDVRDDTLVLDPVRDEPAGDDTEAEAPAEDAPRRDSRTSPDAPGHKSAKRAAPVGAGPDDTIVLDPIRDEPARERGSAGPRGDDAPGQGTPGVDVLTIDVRDKGFSAKDAPVRESPAPAGSIPVGPKTRIVAKAPPGAELPAALPGGPHVERSPDGTRVLTAPAEQGDALLSALLKAHWHIRSVGEEKP